MSAPAEGVLLQSVQPYGNRTILVRVLWFNNALHRALRIQYEYRTSTLLHWVQYEYSYSYEYSSTKQVPYRTVPVQYEYQPSNQGAKQQLSRYRTVLRYGTGTDCTVLCTVAAGPSSAGRQAERWRVLYRSWVPVRIRVLVRVTAPRLPSTSTVRYSYGTVAWRGHLRLLACLLIARRAWHFSHARTVQTTFLKSISRC